MGLRRILVAQGPQQLLLGIAALKQREEEAGRGAEACEDHLVLGDFWAPENAATLDSACRAIAGQHSFATITSSHDLDAVRYQRSLSFPAYVCQLISRLPFSGADELFLTRNTQALNEAILHSFPQARKITLGDGIGIIDNNTLRFSQPNLPGGFVQIDEIFSILPVEAEPGALSGVPVRFIDPERYVRAVEAATAILGREQLTAGVQSGKLTVFVMVPLTEAGWIPEVTTENAFNLECALRHLSPGQDVWIKGHPRQQLGQAAHLAEALRRRGYQAQASEALDAIPVECLASLVPVEKLIAPVSSCCITWRIVQPETELLLGAPEESVRKHFPKTDFFPVNVGVRYLQTLLVAQGRFRALSRSALTAFFREKNLWEAKLDASSGQGAPAENEFIDEAITISESAVSAAPPPDREHRRAASDHLEQLTEGILALDVPLAARAKLLEVGIEMNEAGQKEKAALRAKAAKLKEKVASGSAQLRVIQESSSWKVLRPMFKLEQSLRRRAARPKPPAATA